MSKVKLLLITSVSLLLINLLLVGFMAFGKPHHRPHKAGPKDYIIKKLDLTEQQIAHYEALIEAHKTSRKALHQQMRELKKELYGLLAGEGNMIYKDSIITKIGSLQEKMELLHLEHFAALKSICKAEQVEKFDLLISELADLFAPHKHPRKKE